MEFEYEYEPVRKDNRLSDVMGLGVVVGRANGHVRASVVGYDGVMDEWCVTDIANHDHYTRRDLPTMRAAIEVAKEYVSEGLHDAVVGDWWGEEVSDRYGVAIGEARAVFGTPIRESNKVEVRVPARVPKPVRDWKIIKEVLEEIRGLPLGRGDGRKYINALDAKGDDAEEEDVRETEKWHHARMLRDAGMFMSPIRSRHSVADPHGAFWVDSLSMAGHELLDSLGNAEVMRTLAKLGEQVSMTSMKEGVKILFNAVLNGQLGV